MQIRDFIYALRNTDRYIETIFMQGSCYKFAKLLVDMYGGELVIDSDKSHIGALIDGEVYDITGVVGGKYIWQYLDDEDIELASEWSFMNNSFLQLGECPICEEPLVV